MTEEIIIDGGRMAGITTLKNEIKRLEQERDELKKGCEKCKLFDIEKTSRNLLEQIEKLEQENRELKAYKDVNEDFKKAWDELNKKYTEVLKLAKTNADSNEYCLQELEQENKEIYENGQIEITKLCNENNNLKSALEEIRRVCEKEKAITDKDDELIDVFNRIKNLCEVV